MQFKQMFVTAVCVLFILKLKGPKSKNFYKTMCIGASKGSSAKPLHLDWRTAARTEKREYRSTITTENV